MAEIRWRVRGNPANFNLFHVLASLLHWHRSPEINKTLHDVWLSLGLIHYTYTFWGLLPLTEFCQLQYSRYVQVLRSPILAALLHGTPAAAVCQTLFRGKRNGIMELSQRAPPIFGWATITLGISPHFSLHCFIGVRLPVVTHATLW